MSLQETARKMIAAKIPWPDHNKNHSRTLLNHLLYDESCLRCRLEAELGSSKVDEVGKVQFSK